MSNYDDDPRYEKIDDYTYFDTLTEEHVYVLSPEEKAISLKKAKEKLGFDGSEALSPSIKDIVLGTLEVMNSGKGEIYEKWNEENGLNNVVALGSFIGLCDLTEDGESAIRQAWTSLASRMGVHENELLEIVLNPE